MTASIASRPFLISAVSMSARFSRKPSCERGVRCAVQAPWESIRTDFELTAHRIEAEIARNVSRRRQALNVIERVRLEVCGRQREQPQEDPRRALKEVPGQQRRRTAAGGVERRGEAEELSGAARVLR